MTLLDVSTFAKNDLPDLELLARLTERWNRGTPSECEKEIIDELVAARNSTIDDPLRSLNLVVLLTFSARALSHRKNFSEAAVMLREAESLIRQLGRCPPSVKLAWLLERARLSEGERTPSQARIAYSEAWTIAIESSDESAAVEIAEMMAAIEPSKTKGHWVRKGIELALAAKSDIPKRRLAALYRAEGRDHHAHRRYDDAIESFRKSSTAAKHDANATAEILAESELGKTLRLMQKVEEALELQMNLLRLVESRGERNGEVYEEIAECLHTLKRPDEAEIYYALAYREFVLDPGADDHRSQALKRLKTLGKVKGV